MRITAGLAANSTEGWTSGAVESPAWQIDPARGCAPGNGYDPDMWFDTGEGVKAIAKAICISRCPFRELCDNYATANGEVWGVWGGRNRTRKNGQPARKAAKPGRPRSTHAES